MSQTTRRKSWQRRKLGDKDEIVLWQDASWETRMETSEETRREARVKSSRRKQVRRQKGRQMKSFRQDAMVCDL